MAAIPLRDDIVYPESDGQPMGETGLHVQEIFELMMALQRRYRAVPDVYVASNQFLYYVERQPRFVVCPDLFLVQGVPKEPPRRTYKLWVEGRPPSLVVEFTSDSTQRVDLYEKKEIYARLGVDEYFLFDVLGDYLRPPLQGLRLTGGHPGRYQPIRPGRDGSLPSLTTGLSFRAEDGRLRLIETATGQPVPRVAEFEAEAAREREARKALAIRLRAAEEELARLRRG